jgi:hypothetical protein
MEHQFALYAAGSKLKKKPSKKQPSNVMGFLNRHWYIYICFILLAFYVLNRGGSIEFPGIFKANSKPENNSTKITDTAKPNQTPVQNFQNVEKGGSGFQNNGTNNGIQAVNIKLYTSNAFIPLENSMHKQVLNRLKIVSSINPNAPPIYFWNGSENPPLTPVMDYIFSLLDTAGIKTAPRQQNSFFSWSFPEPFHVMTYPEDTAYVNQIVFALAPYVRLYPKWDFKKNGEREIRFRFSGTPIYRDNGCVFIK